MKLKKMMLSSIVALSLIACGSGEDSSKVDDHKDNLPPKPQACVDAGDKCTWDGKEWVVKPNDGGKPGEGDKPQDDAPAADSNFDYSDIGVTDELKAERRGFGFYNKGDQSPLDSKMFKSVTLSPTIAWSSKLEYDEDLYNFVAIRLADASEKEPTKNPVKFMFDKIGIQNQTENENYHFFGRGVKKAGGYFHSGTFKKTGISSISSEANPTYQWNALPAVVNTFMWRNNLGKWAFKYIDDDKKLFKNQEEETVSTIGSGHTSLRVYGKNAFLEATDPKLVINAREKKRTSFLANPDEEKVPLDVRKVPYFNHVNIVWYDLSELNKRTQKASVEIDTTDPNKFTISPALKGYAFDGKTRAKFPTDVELGTLDSVQFGRLTGEGIDPESDDLPDYNKENLKAYPFTQSGAAVSGNRTGEDWYFARGTEPAPLSALDNFKSAGFKVAFDGQALMFGLDYKPTRVIKPKDKDGNQSTNSVKPADAMAVKAKMPLDGKQGFVRMVWDPTTGEIQGSVYGVWTLATYWREPNSADGTEKLRLLKIAQTDAGSNELAAKVKSEILKEPSADVLGIAVDSTKAMATAKHASKFVAANALVLEPWIVPLVSMKGKVTEGTNSFGGVAVRCKDMDKGLFTGAFFGKSGTEIGGVINSQTGNMKNKDLTDPAEKWGGAFGAKYNGKAVDEDLIFVDPEINYGTSTEFFN